ncbi:dehydrogenase E1 and transketolase domain-containing protein 1 [Tilletiaria anomala UBC 951]|uniref:Dehydrogenase E1 and transketolase domain-containing protein 1 n=1 Tax=Tilletiaria anomala (strain ATCC 24038 / CBS 436.72 / UBC 951) TaxID=1037660 RepID=A0A066VWN6_TILAU|nr:dehydrogenase E1 and transketolase domain-containing protein 1 [Tilletiaria anomala UBC 951]KDN44708.1 dehydrogenase E1 and transketolase domain-containing protein 1 [Tilletiaria anomala UBC 951]
MLLTNRMRGACRLAAGNSSIVGRACGRVTASRSYAGKGAFGFLPPPALTIEDYTPEELANRNANAPLLRYVDNVRRHAHRAALIDPLDLMPREDTVRALSVERYGLLESKQGHAERYDTSGILRMPPVFADSEAQAGTGMRSIAEITEWLRKVYVDKLSVEFMHTGMKGVRNYIMDLFEDVNTHAPLSKDEKRRCLELMTRSEVLDRFLAQRFPNVKRYGNEGAESTLPALDMLFRKSAEAGISSVVLCMPHRGRLSLLTELLGMPLPSLFHKMRGGSEIPTVDSMTGHELAGATADVLSHLVHEPTLRYGDKDIKICMLQNPSHLEAVNPVAMGKARARQTFGKLSASDSDKGVARLGDDVLCVQIHGDAAMSGQGIVMESLGLSELPHYNVGGSIHLVVNNNIGYTTPSTAARSSLYASDIAKMIGAPVLHVNGDHPEEVVKAIKIAVQMRMRFRRDVIVDLITYRRWGHNELDEPRFTQPKMYEKIASRASVPEAYEHRLLSESILSADEASTLRLKRVGEMEAALAETDQYDPTADHLQGKWSVCVWPTSTDAVHEPETGLEPDVARSIGEASVAVPDGFNLHSRLNRHIKQRVESLKEGKGINWATAEAIAFGSLLSEGTHIRLSGEDVQRGTFSQRHAALVDQKTESIHVPLNLADLAASSTAKPPQGRLELANSSLSEEAVLGFEVGVSWDRPDVLPIWEAQFGDFFNGAQVIIDTFIAGGEAKWLKQSALTLLLPHGFDGAGPEHSSCRIERFLQLCNDPFEPPGHVVGSSSLPYSPSLPFINPTTPAQYFHALRRQMKRNYRKPLIIAAPKGLLRSPHAASTLQDFAPGTRFQSVLDDPRFSADASQVEKMVLCSGKHYYTLVEQRAAMKLDEHVALVRLEELSPFPFEQLRSVLGRYKHLFAAASEVGSNASGPHIVWAQEEPRNQGAWVHVSLRLQALLDEVGASGLRLAYRGRKECAVPAVGVSKWHKKEVEEMMADVFK